MYPYAAINPDSGNLHTSNAGPKAHEARIFQFLLNRRGIS